MSFPAYPEYTDSGVVWLGGIPAHWNIKKFRYVFEESPEKITDEVVGDMLSVSGYRGIEVKQYDDEGRRRTDEELFGYRVVRPGQLVVNTMWLNYAGLGVSEHEGHVSPAYRSYWIDPAMDKRFIHHLMRSGTYVQGYTRLLTGIRPNSLQMGRDDLMVFPVLLPTKSEQAQIARFLDHETARIDALIAEQQRLIELLKEKRQAVISHAVTKGLDPTVPMKDSGVEWLGEVPAHWVVLAIKWRARIKSGDGISPDLIESQAQEDKPHPVIGGNGVMGFTSQANVSPPLIVIGRVGALCGNVHKIHEPAWVSDNALILDFDRRSFDVNYLVHVLDARNLNEISDKSAQPLITGSKVTSQYIPCPSRHEQLAIAKFLEGALSEFDQLVFEGIKGIELLKERRSALISAAVTGKIDVRGWQPPASTQAPEPAVAEAV